MSFQKLNAIILCLSIQAKATDLYQGSHEYFASRTFDSTSIALLGLALLLVVVFAAYLIFSTLTKRNTKDR